MWMGIPLLLFAFGAQGVTRGEAYEVESGKDKYWCGCGSRERDLVPTVFLSVNFYVCFFLLAENPWATRVVNRGSWRHFFGEKKGKFDRLAVDDDVDHPRFLVRMFTQQFLSSYFTLYPSETSIELSILLWMRRRNSKTGFTNPSCRISKGASWQCKKYQLRLESSVVTAPKAAVATTAAAK